MNTRRSCSWLVALVACAVINVPASLLAATAVISNERSGDLLFMSDSGELEGIVALCRRPRGMALNTAERILFVACSDDNAVVAFDLDTRQRAGEFVDLPGAMSLAFHAASNRLIISNEGAAQATVIDTRTGEVLAILPTGLEPDGVAVTDDGERIFVVSENAGLVHVYDGASYEAIQHIITQLRPRRMAIRAGELWVSSEMGSRVEIFDTTSLVKKDEIVFAPRGFRSEQLTPVDILFDDAEQTAFVALGSASHVAMIDADSREIQKYILVGRRPWGLALTPDGKQLFVLNGLSDDVTIIDVARRRPVVTRRTGLVPHSVTVLP